MTPAIDSLPDDDAIHRAENRSIRAFRAHKARYPQRALDSLHEYELALKNASIDAPPEKLVLIVDRAIKVIEQQRILLRIPGPPKELVSERAANAQPSVIEMVSEPVQSAPEKISSEPA